jgi:release factor glutamine methyltransferase
MTDDDVRAIEEFAAGDEALLRRSLKRLSLGDPAVYITNRCSVLGRTFYVDRRVYRPSQNTAKMVRYALDRIEDGRSVLDVGTGCGWIAITTKLEKPSSVVHGVDIDADAVEVARKNAGLHGVDVTFAASDFVESIDIPAPDYVIANLPYGAPSTGRNVAINAHMPRIALYHPAGPFAALGELLASLERRGWAPEVFVEAGSQPADAVASAMPRGVEWDLVLLDEAFSVVRLRMPNFGRGEP